MTVYALVPDLKVPLHTSSGNLASGYKLFVYQAGTTTKATTYTDSTGKSSNTNPIVTNARGELPYGVYVAAGSYKLVLTTDTDADPPNSPIWTQDNVPPVNYVPGGAAAATEWTDSGLTPTYVSTTSFSLTGNQTANFHDGRRVRCSLAGSTKYATIVSSSFAAGATTVVLNIDAGSTIDNTISAVAYSFLSAVNPSFPANVTPFECNGRLTLTSGTPVTTGDVTGGSAATVYFTPYKGSVISLYDGAGVWSRYTFSEASVGVPATTSTMYDVFGYMSAGVLTLEAVAWTNDTTRATALALQDGVLVKTGTLTKRYLGSFRTTTVSGQTEDSAAKRYVWNMYNRVQRKMLVQEATASWNYNSTTIRQARNTGTNQLDFVIGVSEDCVFSSVDAEAFNTAGGASTVAFVGIGLDNASVVSSDAVVTRANLSTANSSMILSCKYAGYPGVGRHTLVWLEATNATANNTFQGTVAGSTKSGISGILLG